MGALTKADQTIVKGSLASVAKTSGITVAEALCNAKLVVLLDTSASMSACDAPGQTERYKAACNELAKLQVRNPGAVAVFSFSSSCVFAPSGIPQFLQASTDLAGALRTVKKADDLGLDFCVISDGEPDDSEAALKQAGKFKSKISTIFIGSEDGPGRDFLDKLARVSGGESATQTPETLNLLSDTLSLQLLTA